MTHIKDTSRESKERQTWGPCSRHRNIFDHWSKSIILHLFNYFQIRFIKWYAMYHMRHMICLMCSLKPWTRRFRHRFFPWLIKSKFEKKINLFGSYSEWSVKFSNKIIWVGWVWSISYGPYGIPHTVCPILLWTACKTNDYETLFFHTSIFK